MLGARHRAVLTPRPPDVDESPTFAPGAAGKGLPVGEDAIRALGQLLREHRLPLHHAGACREHNVSEALLSPRLCPRRSPRLCPPFTVQFWLHTTRPSGSAVCVLGKRSAMEKVALAPAMVGASLLMSKVTSPPVRHGDGGSGSSAAAVCPRVCASPCSPRQQSLCCALPSCHGRYRAASQLRNGAGRPAHTEP